ncbi:MAG: pilus assembly protein PilN [endosymbiont of Seepiophila jonesi]|uniref:Pilus assembly protein PilN n=1 Tax=endosymbiont of Lamellibrachia luymesi TaxID=2200907 RepID=A0A370DXK6_9GAMM|nr:MAG: pilus assembly protein PilN [endosymbiont of Seepiophila jonesi]RDH90813.1 MAG: pilus assembly protein PilN [endosymbiont of Lamellibrachia luymesi]
MARINLLPWREAERTKRKREFGFMILGGVIVTIAAIFFMHMHMHMDMDMESLISAQGRRNAYLQQEIDVVKQQIREIRDLGKTKAGLLARMDIIQQLQSSRPQIVHLFDELVATLPDGVHLTSVKQNGALVSVAGRAQSNARVSAYMRNIERSEWLGNPRLDVIENKEATGTGMSHFKLTAKQLASGGGATQ